MIRYRSLIIKMIQCLFLIFPGRFDPRVKSMTEKKLETLRNRVEKLRAEKRTFREKIALLKKEQNRLHRRLRDTRRLLEALPGPVLLIQEEKITYCNEAACKMLGYEEEELLNQLYSAFVHPEWRTEIGERHKRRLSGKPVPNRYEACLVSKSGERLWCEVRVGKMLLGGRRTFVINLVELNERKELERLRTRERKFEALARMSRGMHREMAGWLNRIENGALIPGDVEASGARKSAGKGQVLQEVLESGRMFSGDLACLGGVENASRAEISYDLRKVVKEVVNHAKTKWCDGPEGKGNPIRIKSYLRTLAPLWGSPEEVRAVLTGMVENAVEALPGGGTIYITTERSEGFACVYIQDNGHGIAPELQEIIYDPFFTTRGGKKKGLGLSRAFAVVYGSGGDIALRSEKGEGAAFTIRLPLQPEGKLPTEKAARRRLADVHFLVVSEQDMLRDLLYRLFSDRGSQVTTAVTGWEAFRSLSRNTYDLLMVDMEDVDGDMKGILRKAKKDHPDMSVVVMNVDGETVPRKSSGLRWADLVIGKPLELKRVRALVKELLMGRGLGG
jgi:PAS domain S-box-containing protein